MNQHQSLEAVLDSDVVVIVDDEEWLSITRSGGPTLSVVPNEDDDVLDGEEFAPEAPETWPTEPATPWVETGLLVGSRHPGRLRRQALIKKLALVGILLAAAAGGYFGFLHEGEQAIPVRKTLSVSPDSILAHLQPQTQIEGTAEVDPNENDTPLATSEDPETVVGPGEETPRPNDDPIASPEDPPETADLTENPVTLDTAPNTAGIASFLNDMFQARPTSRLRSSIIAKPTETEPIDDDEVPTILIDGKVYALNTGETIIELDNGSRFRGKVKRIRDGKITLLQGQGEYTFEIEELSAILGTDYPELRPYELLPRARVKLANGASFTGRVSRDNDEEVVLKTETGAMRFDRDQVAVLDYVNKESSQFKPVPNQSRDSWRVLEPKSEDPLESLGPRREWSPGEGVRTIEEDLDRVSDVKIIGDWKKVKKNSP